MENTPRCSICNSPVSPSKGKKPRSYCSRNCMAKASYWRNHQVNIDRNRKWRAANPELYKKIRRESDARSREKINAYAREWRRKHSHSGNCSICGDSKKLVYDHCHSTGKHRGYICRNCNSGLGMFRDDLNILRRAVKYLEEFINGSD